MARAKCLIHKYINICGGGAKSPLRVAGCTGFWEAYDPATLFTDAGVTPVSADGDKVYQMNDKSGGGHHFVQTTEAQRPLYKVNRQNGKAALLFDGISQGMVNALGIAHLIAVDKATIFLAFKLISSGDNDIVFADNGYVLYIHTAVDRYSFYNWTGAVYDQQPTTIVDGTPYLSTLWHGGGNIYAQVNNGTPNAPVASGNTELLVAEPYLFRNSGGTTFLEGDFYAMATFNVALSDKDRRSINRYFMQKLGL